jgi:hypothetical protein
MIADLIRFILQNLPAILLVAALVVPTVSRGMRPAAEDYLGWVLLLPIGVAGLWGGFFHIFFPEVAASMIGWQTSPFQFEVGMADIAIGVTACLAFWRSLSFKAAAVCVASISFLGDAVGHVRQMAIAGNFHSGNAGVPFFLDLIAPALAIGLLVAAYRAIPRRLPSQ